MLNSSDQRKKHDVNLDARSGFDDFAKREGKRGAATSSHETPLDPSWFSHFRNNNAGEGRRYSPHTERKLRQEMADRRAKQEEQRRKHHQDFMNQNMKFQDWYRKMSEEPAKATPPSPPTPPKKEKSTAAGGYHRNYQKSKTPHPIKLDPPEGQSRSNTKRKRSERSDDKKLFQRSNPPNPVQSHVDRIRETEAAVKRARDRIDELKLEQEVERKLRSRERKSKEELDRQQELYQQQRISAILAADTKRQRDTKLAFNRRQAELIQKLREDEQRLYREIQINKARHRDMMRNLAEERQGAQYP